MIDFGLGVSLRVPSCHEAYRAWRNDPAIWRWTRQNDLLSESDQERWAERLATDPTIRMYGVYSGDVRLVGVCGLTSINWQNRNAEFSLYISPEEGRKGLGRKALLTLFYHGFINMGLKSIWGETFENNPAKELFRKIGMVEDGRRRQFYWKDGLYWDAILFSLLSEEFLNLHQAKSCFPPS